jgi:glycosyltransferase involved in cell wall biosynthesis
MRVAVVGPTHPLKGGVAAHTTELAHHLAGAGHRVDLVSWSRLYPARLYPGEQLVPSGVPDVEPYPRSTRPLSWARPDSWWRVGRSLRRHDLVVVVHVVPAVAPAHLALLRAARAGGSRPGRLAGPDPTPRVVVVAHNVLPHEPHPGARLLARRLFRRADRLVVHSAEQAEQARRLGVREVTRVALPPHLPGGPREPRPPHDGPPRLLALGIVRDYKGVDLLIRALREVPGPTLTVAGELWGSAGDAVRALAADPVLAGRVDLRPGYVPGPEVAGLLARHDVLALPYRAATASQNVQLGFAHGLPVLATRAGTFATDVRDGTDGVLVEPGSVAELAEGLRRLVSTDVLDGLRAGVRGPDLRTPWVGYLRALGACVEAPRAASA